MRLILPEMYSLFQQKNTLKITPGREKVLALHKLVQDLRKQNPEKCSQIKIRKSHPISYFSLPYAKYLQIDASIRPIFSNVKPVISNFASPITKSQEDLFLLPLPSPFTYQIKKMLVPSLIQHVLFYQINQVSLSLSIIL